jgi:hypothetical protein
MLVVSHIKGRCAKLLLSCLFCKNDCLYCTVRIVVGFLYVYKNIVSILVSMQEYFFCVFWCLHCNDSGGILVDCNTQILVVFWCLSCKNFGGSPYTSNACTFSPFQGLA